MGWYVALALVAAALSYLAVQALFLWELARAGLLASSVGPGELLGRGLGGHVASLLCWLALGGAVGVVVGRLSGAPSRGSLTAAPAPAPAEQPPAPRDARQEAAALDRPDRLLALEIAEALTASLDPVDLAATCLPRIAATLAPDTTAAVLLQDEDARVLRVVAAVGPARDTLAGGVYALAALPDGWCRRDGGPPESLVLADTALAGPAASALTAALPAAHTARSLALMPLVSRDRLVGALLLLHAAPHRLDARRLRGVTLWSRYLAGALHSALAVLEAERRAERASLLNRLAERARASLDPHEVLSTAVEAVGRALSASRVVVRLEATEVDVQAAYEWTAPGVPGRDAGAPPGAGDRALQEGSPVVIDDTRLVAAPGAPPDTRALLAAPIILGGRLVGVLAVHQVDAPRGWSADDVRLVEAVARELRVAIATARLFRARKRESERLLALHRASRALAAQTAPEVVLAEVLRSAVALLGAGSGAFYRWDPEAAVLRCVRHQGMPAAQPAPAVRLGEGAAGRTFARLEPLMLVDYPTWGGDAGDLPAGVQAVLAVPLLCSGTPLGVLLVCSYEPATRFTDDDLRLLTLFGDQAAAAFLTAEAFERQRQALAALEHLNKAKSDFVSVVSHEFRTPLTGIRGFSEMMMEEDFSLAEMREFAADINREAQRLTRLINDMLDLERLEAGRMPLHVEVVDLHGVLAEVAERTRLTAPRHPIRLALASSLPPLAADRDKIVQVITNLLSNAVKYSPRGGEIVVSSRVEGDMVHVAVRDHGIGIPAAALEKVFERYTRIETGSGRSIQGTGLGLPIVRQIVELHGGRVWAESVEGEGSTFHFTLPLGAAPTPPAAAMDQRAGLYAPRGDEAAR